MKQILLIFITSVSCFVHAMDDVTRFGFNPPVEKKEITPDLGTALFFFRSDIRTITPEEGEQQNIARAKRETAAFFALHFKPQPCKEANDLLLTTSMYDELVGVSRALIEHNFADIEHTNHMNNNPLILAAGSAAYNTVKLLLEKKANVHVRNLWSGSTPLHCLCSPHCAAFCKEGQAADNPCKTAQLLLEHGSSLINTSTKLNENPLHAILKKDDSHCPKHGEKCYYNAPCSKQIRTQRAKLAKLLIDWGCDLYARNKNEKKPLDDCYNNFADFAVKTHQQRRTALHILMRHRVGQSISQERANDESLQESDSEIAGIIVNYAVPSKR